MKAVILAAGIPRFGFPVDSKPKCLFHYQGEVILERLVRVLKKVGITEIIIVGGYKIEMIQQFNEEKKLGLKLVYNPTATSTEWTAWLDSVRVGLEGLDDDVLLIFGDVLLNEEGVRRIMEHPKRCISLFSFGYQMYKIPKELLPKLREYTHMHVHGPMHALNAFCMVNNGVKMYIGTTPEGVIKDSASMRDVDDYNMTDEAKKAKGR